MLEKGVIKKRVFFTILFSLVLPLIMFISIPLELYMNNADEFIFKIEHFIGLSVVFFLVFFIVNFLILFFLPKKAFKIVSSIFVAIGFMFFMQGTFLNGQFNTLQGDNFEGSGPSTFMIVLDIILWLLVIGGAIFLALLKDKKQIIPAVFTIIAITVSITYVIIPTSCLITNTQAFTPQSNTYITDKNLDYISNNKNIFYFVVDRFDEVYAEEAIEKNPHIYDKLNGFTWFKDNVSKYGHTFPAVANMLTRKNHEMEKSRKDFLNSTYLENNTLKVLADNGYEVNLFTDSFYSYDDAKLLPNYISNTLNFSTDIYKINNPATLSFALTGVSLYRCLPFGVKSIFREISSYTCNEQVTIKSKDGYAKYSCKNERVYEYVKNAKIKSKDKNMFNFIHFSGCHDSGHNNTYNSVKLSFEMINKYIDAMINLGVYDDATIIITGDHSAPYNDMTDVISSNQPRLTALFVKNGNSGNEPLKQSNAQTSHDNIWATIMKSQNIIGQNDNTYGPSLFEINENENQTRTYIWHTYLSHVCEYTYEITGPARNLKNWKQVNKQVFQKHITD